MRSRGSIRAAALIAVCAAAAVQAAQPASRVARGRERYMALCASCHGPDGAGGGPAASSLKMPLPDLRRIAERRGGFDRTTIAATIDGRAMAGAHGSLDMPVWGWKGLRARKGETGPSPGMLDLLAYLQSIQVKP